MASRETTTIPHLKAWRLYRVKSAKELALATGVSEQTIHRLERPGERANTLTARKLARALDVSYEQLLSEDPEKKDWAA